MTRPSFTATVYDNQYNAMTEQDTPASFWSASDAFRDAQRQANKKRDVRLSRYEGQLPMHTTPRLCKFNQMESRIEPETTRGVSPRCSFNERVEAQGPFYLRHWQIFDNAPFLPSEGDVTKDPRYSVMTKGHSADYRLVPAGSGVFENATVDRTRPAIGPGFAGYSLV